MPKPKRIEPVLDAESGQPSELNPPCGGSWIREADGGLAPADESTARAAGLGWGDEPDESDPATSDTAQATVQADDAAPAALATRKRTR